jgi:ribonuclease VapC
VVRCVLDASAVLSWLQNEPGEGVVDPLLDESLVSAANWSEILQKVGSKGRSMDETADLIKAVGVQIAQLTEEDAARAASLWFQAPFLSLADRFCLALAHRLGAVAVTADRSWREVPAGVEVTCIR